MFQMGMISNSAHFSYLIVFVEFWVARSRKVSFNKPELNAAFLDHALIAAR